MSRMWERLCPGYGKGCVQDVGNSCVQDVGKAVSRMWGTAVSRMWGTAVSRMQDTAEVTSSNPTSFRNHNTQTHEVNVIRTNSKQLWSVQGHRNNVCYVPAVTRLNILPTLSILAI